MKKLNFIFAFILLNISLINTKERFIGIGPLPPEDIDYDIIDIDSSGLSAEHIPNVRPPDYSETLSWWLDALTEAVSRRGAAAADTNSTLALSPVMTIAGKEDPRVYLHSLDIQIDVTGGIASTRYKMIFKNRTMYDIGDGEIMFRLPDGVTLTHYAREIGGELRDGVPMGKMSPMQSFGKTHWWTRHQLGKTNDGNYRAGIYPISAYGDIVVSVGYDEPLTSVEGALRYSLPIAYARPLKRFSAKATVWNGKHKPSVSESSEEILFVKSGNNYAAKFIRHNYKPSRALTFSLPAPVDTPHVITQSVGGNRYFLVSVEPKMEARKKRWADEIAVIWDVSLSGSRRDLKRELDALGIIFADKKNIDVNLYFLSNRFKRVVNKNRAGGLYRVNNGNWNELKKVLETAAYDGGTDYSQIKLSDINGSEILFFTDGLPTLSGIDFLMRNAEGGTRNESQNIVPNSTLRPIHCIVSSPASDHGVMRFISGKTNGKFIDMNALSSEQLKNELLNDLPMFWGIEHDNAVKDVYPSIVTPVRGNFSVAGICNSDSVELALLFGYGGIVEKRIRVQSKDMDAKNTASGGDIHRIWAQKKIAELDMDYENNRGELKKLGREFGLLTRNTSYLVLAYEIDSIRYNAEPPATVSELIAEAEEKYFGLGAAAVLRDWYRGELKIISSDYFMCDCNTYYSYPNENIAPFRQDRDYMDKLKGRAAADYQTYLKLRNDYARSPYFYFDMADHFYRLNDRETALRILTSVADLDFENASLYRLLGYTFKEYGEYALQKFVCQKVVEQHPAPQSYRDYALALADNGEAQAALDLLYSLLTKRGVLDFETVVVAEINRLIAKYPDLDISRIDNGLITNIPVDIRVVINWNTDDYVGNLYVVNPSGEECGLLNDSCYGYMNGLPNLSGLGPIQFMLKDAAKGKYRIRVGLDDTGKFGINKYDDFTPKGPTTIMAEIYTKYAGEDERRRVVTVQLDKAKAERRMIHPLRYDRKTLRLYRDYASVDSVDVVDVAEIEF